VLSGIVITVVALALAAFMVVALLHEIIVGNFYGACVSALVLTFGTQLTRIGWRMIWRASAAPAAPQAADGLWQSESRVYPHLPQSHLEIRGR